MKDLQVRALAWAQRHPWLSTFLGCLVVYAATAHWNSGQNQDSVAASWPAWSFVHTGSFRLDAVHGLPSNPWFGIADGHLVSFRTAGVVLTALPAQLLLGWTSISAEAAGALTAVLLSAAAIANVRLALQPLVGAALALRCAVLLGFGTAMWTVGSAELWTHGPDVFWCSLALLALSQDRVVVAGMAMAPAVVTRPHLAVVAATLGLWRAAEQRRIKPLLAFGLPGAGAVAALFAWNGWYYGRPSLQGAYAGHLEAATSLQHGAGSYVLNNLAGALFSPWCGVFLYTPAAVVVLLSWHCGLRKAPGWVLSAAVGGFLYEIVQAKMNGFSGGGAFYGNRLVLEGMTLCAPLAAHGYNRWRSAGWRHTLATVTSAASISIFATGALLHTWWWGDGADYEWGWWYPAFVVKTAGPYGFMVAGLTIIAAATVILRPSQGTATTVTEPATA